MRKYIVAAAAALATLATPAVAAQINISVSGVLTTQLDAHGADNTGVDPNLSVGSIFTLTASFDDSLLVPYSWGAPGDMAVGLYGAPTTGNTFFRIDAAGMTWQSSDDLHDGIPIPSLSGIEAPIIVIDGGKVVGLIGDLLPAKSSARPDITLGYGEPDVFHIQAGNALYGNVYNSPGFLGTWDFANSSVVDPPSTDTVVAAVPEPATWAMFLIGFGAVGFRMRQRAVLA